MVAGAGGGVGADLGIGGFGDSKSAKIAAVSLGVFGLIYQILMVALFLGAIAPADIEAYFVGASMLLLFHIVAMAFIFKKSISSNE